ncbi:DUF6519 domain-containing protein [Moorena producens]|uniref:DUF6519 domain-containing protein n=1 Tax=Moorena producens TaxID=1155739 RepID=UPI003C719B0C
MKGDFTRWTFDASNRYSSVRLQQGRVLLDADWNEQLDIMAHREQYANKEIIGLHGVPDLSSFAVEFPDNENIKLGAGRCYVEGVLCEKIGEELQEISTVPGLEEPSNNDDYLVYLEVWQHHITAIEDQNLVEPALGGPDTTTRTQTFWQLKAEKLTDTKKEKWREKWKEILDDNQEKGKLKVKSGTGLPNDLYRVEIHEVSEKVEDTTFKWARNNASMAARVIEIGDKTVKIEKNNQIQFPEGQGKETWIEITDQERVKAGEPGVFLEVENVGEDNTLLTINSMPDGIDELDLENTTVRIWEDQPNPIKSSLDKDYLIELEKGLKVSFVKDKNTEAYYKNYRTGDYWLIPTRSQQEVVWPQEGGGPQGKEPDGIVYHYCPLAIVNYDESQWTVPQDCREVFPALTEMARETVISNKNAKGEEITTGRKLSIGVHSYNDARRDQNTEAIHTDDQLNIQGGKQLTLNAGYWQDNLGGDFSQDDQKIIFSINAEEVMRLTKKNLSISSIKNLIVEGTSHLQGVVSIGKQDPDETIGLLVQPDLSASSKNGLIGQKLAPTLTAYADQDTLTALDIYPTFENNSKSKVSHYGLKVQKGKVFIGELEKWEEFTPGNGTIPPSPDSTWHIGVDVRSTVYASTAGDKLVGLYINPDFQNCYQSKVDWYGLIVDQGKVGIGRKALRDTPINHQIGVNLRPKVDATNSGEKLVGLYINPEFIECDCSITEKEKYGLIVEGGRVAFGPKIQVEGNPVQEYLVDIGTDGDVNRLKVAGDLEVYGKVTYHAEKGAPGNVELGQQNQDKLEIHGKLETKHTSGKLKVTSPLEIQLEEGDTQDFLSLFAANPTDDFNARIVWKKGTVTNPSDPYSEEAKEVAAIYSITNGDGSENSTGDLRFGTSASGGQLTDRMVITADGNVGIGQIDASNPGENQLKVTGTTDLDTLVVNTKLEVKDDATTELNSLKLTAIQAKDNPTLTIQNGNVCIGDGTIPSIEEYANYSNIRFYVTGNNKEIVSFKDIDVSVSGGSTDVDKLTVSPSLTAIKDEEKLVAATIDPTFNIYQKKNVKTLGLLVASGDVQIGGVQLRDQKSVQPTLKVLPELKGTSNATEITPKLTSTGNNQILTAVKIAPNFSGGHGGQKKFGLLVETGDVQVGGDSNIALKVNTTDQEVGIGGESESGYKLAVTGDTKLTGKLHIEPQDLTGASNAVEIKPAFTGTGIQTAVHIEPTFDGNGEPKFGLQVNGNVALCSTSGGVAIGSDQPDSNNKLKVTGGSTLLEGILTVAPSLTGASNAVEIKPAFTGTGIQTAVHIEPTFDGNEDQKFGLQVNGNVALCSTSGGVAIGSNDPTGHKLRVTDGSMCLDGTLTATDNVLVATEITPKLTSSDNEQTLTALRINPNFTITGGNTGVKQLGLVVDSGDVQVGGDSNIALKVNTTDQEVGIGGDSLENYKLAVTGDTKLTGKLVVAGQTKIKGQDLVLQVDNNANQQGVLFQNSGGHYTWRIYRENAGTDDASLKISGGYNVENVEELTDRVTIDRDGAVGIGKVPGEGGESTVTDLKLDVNGQIQANNVALTSDATLKENVKPLKNGLKKILGLRGVSYQWKDEQNASQETQIGLVAQEVEKVFPELVSTDSQGMKSMSYSKLIAPLIEAIKEQNKKILELAKQVKQQQTKITQLQALNKE